MFDVTGIIAKGTFSGNTVTVRTPTSVAATHGINFGNPNQGQPRPQFDSRDVRNPAAAQPQSGEITRNGETVEFSSRQPQPAGYSSIAATPHGRRAILAAQALAPTNPPLHRFAYTPQGIRLIAEALQLRRAA